MLQALRIFRNSLWDRQISPLIYTVPVVGGHQIQAHDHAYFSNGTFGAQAFKTVTATGDCRNTVKSSGWHEQVVSGYPNRAVRGQLRLEYYGSSQHKCV